MYREILRTKEGLYIQQKREGDCCGGVRQPTASRAQSADGEPRRPRPVSFERCSWAQR